MSEHPIYNYMPPEATEEDLIVCARICDDPIFVSDATGLTNFDKWNHTKRVFDATNANLFSIISFEAIYANDEVVACEAASFMADLRVQFFEHYLATEKDDLNLHMLWLRNKQWYVKLRERANLRHVTKSLYGVPLT